MESSSKEVIVGIDFGSSGSGFAYSFMNENNIVHGEILGADTDKKVLTEIILNDRLEILEFGSRCKTFLKEKGLDQGDYFKDIKMHLYKETPCIKASNTGKTLPITIVIEKVLLKLKELCLDQMRKSWKNVEDLKIRWVVTVPAIWKEMEKCIMMEASIKAGLIKENDDKSMFFALEPEAVSLYCSRNDNINADLIKEGETYVICDLGGGTGDIVTHKVGGNKKLEEILPSCGGAYGSNEINRKIFSEIIKKIFGFDNFNSLRESYKYLSVDEKDERALFNDWCALEENIKEYKEGITINKVKNKEKYPICCSVFQEFFESNELSKLIDKYNSSVRNVDCRLTVQSKKKWIIEFPYQIINNYIEDQSKLISKEIRSILSDTKIKLNEKIRTVIFAGGYCSNEVLISSIKNNLRNDIQNFLQPSHPSLAIMEGAVLFGLNPNLINIRIAKYTIGMETRSVWDEKLHSGKGKKVYDDIENKWRCENCFSKFIEVGQKLKPNQDIKPQSFTMLSPRIATLKFYKTLDPNPVFTFDNGVVKMGHFDLDAGKDYPVGERGFKVYMKFGGTFVDIKAVHDKSGNYIKAKFKFN